MLTTCLVKETLRRSWQASNGLGEVRVKYKYPDVDPVPVLVSITLGNAPDDQRLRLNPPWTITRTDCWKRIPSNVDVFALSLVPNTRGRVKPFNVTLELQWPSCIKDNVQSTLQLQDQHDAIGVMSSDIRPTHDLQSEWTLTASSRVVITRYKIWKWRRMMVRLVYLYLPGNTEWLIELWRLFNHHDLHRLRLQLVTNQSLTLCQPMADQFSRNNV